MKDVIVLHHTAVKGIDPQINIIKAHHKKRFGNKMKDSSYHCLIEKGGKIIWHPDGLDAVLYHAGSWNERAIGIAIAGHLGQEPPTPEQIKSLVDAVDWVKHWKTIKFTYNHREVRPTACPKLDLRALYDKEKKRRQVPVNHDARNSALLRSALRGWKRARGDTREILARRIERLKHRLEARHHSTKDCCPHE